MEFLIVAHDQADAGALVRRMVVRERQLAAARRAVESGHMLIGGAILDDRGRMVGSMIVASFPNRLALDGWLRDLPYVKNDVWGRIEVYPYDVVVMASPTPDESEQNGDHREAPGSAPPCIGEERR